MATLAFWARDYPGYFEVGNTRELAQLLTRAETSAEYLAELKAGLRVWLAFLIPRVSRKPGQI